MPKFDDLLAALDPDPRVRGKQFEHVCKWFLANDPMYKATLRRVWLWNDWPGRWGIDAGIDLVAEDGSGQFRRRWTRRSIPSPKPTLTSSCRSHHVRGHGPVGEKKKLLISFLCCAAAISR